MNQKQWVNCTDPEKLLKFLRGKASDRKLRLLACACVRRVWEILTPKSRAALEASERYADKAAGRRELTAARRDAIVEADRMAAAADATMNPNEGQWDPEEAAAAQANAAEATRLCLVPVADTDLVGQVTRSMFYALVQWHDSPGGDPDQAHCDLLREVFGNPFRIPVIERPWLKWNDGTVPRLAQAVYDERNFDLLPVLADALEDAGCAEAAILDHLRDLRPHVRGCWMVDLLLNKK
jgi:hypothetical protein